MESLVLPATIAVVTTVMKKALEKTGEKLGEKTFKLTDEFLSSLQSKQPETASAIQKSLDSTKPIDYTQAALEVSKLAGKDSKFADTIQALAEVAENEENTNLSKIINEIKDILQSQQPLSQNMNKVADKIAVFNQGIIHDQINNINI